MKQHKCVKESHFNKKQLTGPEGTCTNTELLTFEFIGRFLILDISERVPGFSQQLDSI